MVFEGFVHIWKEGIRNSECVNEIMMESKGGKKKSNSSSTSLFYDAPLGYSIEEIRPNGGIKKYKSSVYSNSAKRPSQQGEMALSAIGFEGYEKRPQVSFFEPRIFQDSKGLGLRTLTRSQLEEILTPAACEIVSSLSNDHFDSYVLSESSFFVYPYKSSSRFVAPPSSSSLPRISLTWPVSSL
ncbi:hypothetical protein Bca4012_063872 [Brassica carinata]